MSNDAKTFFISTAIPYVNSVPHLGFALEIIQADVLARYRRIKGDDVFFLTGTDENALKNVLAARELRVETRELVDKNAAEFKKLKEILNLSWGDFIRTTESRHFAGAQKLWLAVSRDIYKKKYRGLYCVGCEEFKTQKELVNSYCPEHPKVKPEEVEEENYFFRLSEYQDKLEKLVVSGKLKITPESRRNETLAFIRHGLEDLSVSRSRERARGWGVPVPGDDGQIIYVWLEALSNYVNALGYAENSANFQKYWQSGDLVLHVVGKGVNRFHSVYWPAILLSAGVSLPSQIFVHGYLTVNGEKISKSLGNVISPEEVVSKYGTDPVRYYLLREIPTYEDGDFSYKKFEDRYNGELANGLGNLVSRVAALGEKISPLKFDFAEDIDSSVKKEAERIFAAYEKALEGIRLNEALGLIWELISFADRYINKKRPWETKEPEKLKPVMAGSGYLIGTAANLLEPFLPETAEKIREQVGFEDSIINIKKGKALFPRLK